jgi:serine/threonine protein kinase
MEKLGRYEIVGELGRGGCGIVYRASDPKIGRQVAIKTIVTQPAEDPTATNDLLVRLKREAQSAGALSHPNIVTVHELAEEGDITYIVMEHVTGKNLRQVMSAGRLPDQTIVAILKQAADALDYAHSSNVVHRDVKPANLLLTDRGVLKITDFGIAKLLNEGTTGVTQTGVMIGTTQYMAPEQIELKPIDGRADQFALGVMAYEMLTGSRPFQGDSLASIIHQVLSVEPPPIEQYREGLSPDTTIVLRRAMAKKPRDRYASCTEFIKDLEAVVLGVGNGTLTIATPTAASLAPTPAAAPPPKKSRGQLVWLLAALATAAVGVQSYRVFYSQPEASPAAPAAPVSASSIPPASQPVLSTPPPTTPPPKPPMPAIVAPPKQEGAKKQDPPTAKRQPESVTTPVPETPVPEPVRSEPPPPPAAPSVPDPEMPPGGKYRGPPEGSFSWSGTLAARGTLVLAGNRASSGAIAGRGLPVGIALTIEVTPSDVRVIDLPSAGNRYRLTLSNQARGDVSALTVRWRERRE